MAERKPRQYKKNDAITLLIDAWQKYGNIQISGFPPQINENEVSSEVPLPLLNHIFAPDGSFLKEKLSQSKKLRILVGASGVGKTPLAGDIARTQEAEGAEIKHDSFDFIIQQLKTEGFPINTMTWTTNHWNELDRRMGNAFINALLGKHNVIFQTVMPDGKRENRGVGAFSRLFSFLQENPQFQNEVEIDLIAADKAVQDLPTKERRWVQNLVFSDLPRVKRMTESKFHARYINTEEYINSLSPEELQNIPGYNEYINGDPRYLHGAIYKKFVSIAAPPIRHALYKREWWNPAIHAATNGTTDPNQITAKIFEEGGRGVEDITTLKASIVYAQHWLKKFLPPNLQHIGQVVVNQFSRDIVVIRDAKEHIKKVA